MERLKELFDFFDTNSDGVISRSELIELVDVLLSKDIFVLWPLWNRRKTVFIQKVKQYL